MARTDRQQRRQRRAEKLGTPPLQPARPQKVEPVREVAPEKTEARAERPAADAGKQRTGIFGFFKEAWAELKKVEWPSQQQVVSGTAVVIVACVIVGVYLYANDRVWRYLVEHVLLR